MIIGFDAKRAFLNKSGLGNYSRFLIGALAKYQPDQQYFLFTPKTSDLFIPTGTSQKEVQPQKYFHRKFPSLWRSLWLTNELIGYHLDIYHGLSNELPPGIAKTKIKTVVSIHDLIFLRYPHYYPFIDRQIYRKKFHNACKMADTIIAISEQTRDDIMDFFKIEPGRIEVLYQGCDPLFFRKVDREAKDRIRKKYQLPDEFMLTVGTIEKRKNQWGIIKAMNERKIDFPLVIIGKPTAYFEDLKKYIEKYRVKNVFLLNYVPGDELPGFYQMAKLFLYPSFFEGFGIPIIEALAAGVPVITSKGGCFHEAGGPGSKYIDPGDSDEIGETILALLEDDEGRKKMADEGQKYVQRFSGEYISEKLMKIYKKLN